jgi:hypothetical protein
MSVHDFSLLYAQYPMIIETMKDQFTSHQFILELARQNQTLYIEALYSYRHHIHRDSPAPFLIVHGVLANNLLKYPRLIRQVQKYAPSKNIFGEEDTCSEWVKLK